MSTYFLRAQRKLKFKVEINLKQIFVIDSKQLHIELVVTELCELWYRQLERLSSYNNIIYRHNYLNARNTIRKLVAESMYYGVTVLNNAKQFTTY